MFPDDKIIEIFSMCDDFSKNFDDIIQKNSIDARESTKKRKYHRDGTMSDFFTGQPHQNHIVKINQNG